MRAVRAAFVDECTRLTEVLGTLDRADLDRPTACRPWTVAQLLAHVRIGAGRLAGMLAASVSAAEPASAVGLVDAAEPAPAVGLVDAVGYFGAAKFTPEVDAARVTDGCREAARAHDSGRALAEGFERAWRSSDIALDAVPPDRVVRTRHGDAMTVAEFLRTRVVEVAVHGLDLAAALERPPWLASGAARVVVDLLTGGRPVPPELGGDDLALVRALTGRAELTPAARAARSRAAFPPLFFAP